MLRCIISFILIVTFTLTSVAPSSMAQVLSSPVQNNFVETGLKPVSTILPSVPLFNGIKIYPQEPFRFDFIMNEVTSNEKRETGTDDRYALPVTRYAQVSNQELLKLVKYFMASLTVPEGDLWVNLSPYEPDRIVPQALGQTEMGRDLLSQDYILKQLTASLMNPEGESGKKFWEKVYEKVYESQSFKVSESQSFKVSESQSFKVSESQSFKVSESQAQLSSSNTTTLSSQRKLGSSVFQEIANDTGSSTKAFEDDSLDQVIQFFNKVWIVPDKVEVYQNGDVAYIVSAKLKVMMESDYLAKTRHSEERSDEESKFRSFADAQDDGGVKDIIRSIIIPLIEDEVNNGEAFANLRQIFHSMILAKWYEQHFKNSILGQSYVDKNVTEGIGYEKVTSNEERETSTEDVRYALPVTRYQTINDIYNQYVAAFKSSANQIIKEDYDPVTQTIVPRKYFVGGIEGRMNINQANFSPAMLAMSEQVVSVVMDSDRAMMIQKTLSDYLRNILARISIFLKIKPASIKVISKNNEIVMEEKLPINNLEEDNPVIMQESFSKLDALTTKNLVGSVVYDQDNVRKIYSILGKSKLKQMVLGTISADKNVYKMSNQLVLRAAELLNGNLKSTDVKFQGFLWLTMFVQHSLENAFDAYAQSLKNKNVSNEKEDLKIDFYMRSDGDEIELFIVNNGADVAESFRTSFKSLDRNSSGGAGEGLRHMDIFAQQIGGNARLYGRRSFDGKDGAILEIGLNREILRRNLQLGNAVNKVMNKAVIIPATTKRKIAKQIHQIEMGLGNIDKRSVTRKIKAMFHAFEYQTIPYPLRGEDLDVLSGVGEDAKIVGQVDSTIAHHLGYIHEVATVILVSPDGKEWIMQKRDPHTKDYPGYLTIPGGHLDPGENTLAAAVRETREEMGLDIAPDDLVFVGHDLYDLKGSNRGDEITFNNRERRSFYLHVLSESEYQHVREVKNFLDQQRRDLSYEEYKAWLRIEQNNHHSPYGESFSIHFVSVDDIWKARKNEEGERFASVDDLGGKQDAFFTPDLLQRVIETPKLTDSVKAAIEKKFVLSDKAMMATSVKEFGNFHDDLYARKGDRLPWGPDRTNQTILLNLLENYLQEVRSQKDIRILNLGAGNGLGGSLEIAKMNQTLGLKDVIQTTHVDISAEALKQFRERLSVEDLTTATLRSEDFVSFLQNAQFDAYDAVYANLTLHYFDWETTQQMFKDIQRILKPGGKLFFRVFSSTDIKIKELNRVDDRGLYDMTGGNEMRFFDLDTIRDAIGFDFQIIHSEITKEEKFYDTVVMELQKPMDAAMMAQDPSLREKEKIYYQTVIDWVRYIFDNYDSKFERGKLVFIGGSSRRAYEAAKYLAESENYPHIQKNDIVYLDATRAAHVSNETLKEFLKEQGVFNEERPVVLLDNWADTSRHVNHIKSAIRQQDSSVLIYTMVASSDVDFGNYEGDFLEKSHSIREAGVFFERNNHMQRDIRRQILVGYNSDFGTLQPYYLTVMDVEKFLGREQEISLDNLPFIMRLWLRQQGVNMFFKGDSQRARDLLEQFVKENPPERAQEQDDIFAEMLSQNKAQLQNKNGGIDLNNLNMEEADMIQRPIDKAMISEKKPIEMIQMLNKAVFGREVFLDGNYQYNLNLFSQFVVNVGIRSGVGIDHILPTMSRDFFICHGIIIRNIRNKKFVFVHIDYGLETLENPEINELLGLLGEGEKDAIYVGSRSDLTNYWVKESQRYLDKKGVSRHQIIKIPNKDEGWSMIFLPLVNQILFLWPGDGNTTKAYMIDAFQDVDKAVLQKGGIDLNHLNMQTSGEATQIQMPADAAMMNGAAMPFKTLTPRIINIGTVQLGMFLGLNKEQPDSDGIDDLPYEMAAIKEET